MVNAQWPSRRAVPYREVLDPGGLFSIIREANYTTTLLWVKQYCWAALLASGVG